MLRPSILKVMECYVYILSDPSDNEIFYVGKGRGNRVFSHLTDQSDNPKTRKIKVRGGTNIKAILNQNFKSI